jgi:hypothetical protein
MSGFRLVVRSMRRLLTLAATFGWTVPGIIAGPLPDPFTEPGFGCVESRQDYRLNDPVLELQRRAASDFPELPAPLFAVRFDNTWYDTSDVAFYLLIRGEGPHKRPRFLARTTERTKGTVRKTSWWELATRPGIRADDLGFFLPEKSDRVVVVPAVNDALPLLRVTRLSSSSGMNTDYRYEDHVLLDFRKTPPRVRAELHCEAAEGGGACGAPDRGWSARNAVGCTWRPARTDFLCEVASEVPYPWVKRHFRSRFQLLSGEEVPGETSGDGPRNLREFAESVERDAGRSGWPARLPGTFHHIARIAPNSPGQRILHVFAAPLETNVFDQRFFVVAIGGPYAETREIRASQTFLRGPDDTSALESGESKADEEAEDGTWQELDVKRTYGVRTILDRRPDLLVLQVVVSEGSSRGLFWIGLEEREGGAPVADVLRLATDAAEYVQCNRFRHAASVVEIATRDSPFQATFRVQPVWSDGNVRETESSPPTYPPSLCLEPWTLTWTKGRGFSLVRTASECEAPRRPLHLEIGKGGEIRRVESSYQHD